jgi:hypothetical protein
MFAVCAWTQIAVFAENEKIIDYTRKTLTACQQDVRTARMFPKNDKSGTSCYHLVTMGSTDPQQVVPTSLISST